MYIIIQYFFLDNTKVILFTTKLQNNLILIAIWHQDNCRINPAYAYRCITMQQILLESTPRHIALHTANYSYVNTISTTVLTL